MRLLSIAAAALAFSVAAPAFAQTPRPIDQFKYWGAYAYKDPKVGEFCYILAIPTAKEPVDRDHGDVYFLVSRKPGSAEAYEPQVEVGYKLREGADVDIQVDGKRFAMFSKDNKAWLKDVNKENELVAAMRAGSTMKVSGESNRGTQTSYTYSLSGVTAALREINKCK